MTFGGDIIHPVMVTYSVFFSVCLFWISQFFRDIYPIFKKGIKDCCKMRGKLPTTVVGIQELKTKSTNTIAIIVVTNYSMNIKSTEREILQYFKIVLL